MKKRIVLYFIFGLFFLLAGKTDIFAVWQCCKGTGASGGGYCTVSGGRDPTTFLQRCSEGDPWCQTATPHCPDGWSTSAPFGNYDSTTVYCNDCNNDGLTCYKWKATSCSGGESCLAGNSCSSIGYYGSGDFCEEAEGKSGICCGEKIYQPQCLPGDWDYVGCDTTATCNNSNGGTCDPADCTGVTKPADRTPSELPATCCTNGTWSFVGCDTTATCTGTTATCKDLNGDYSCDSNTKPTDRTPSQLPSDCSVPYFFCNGSSCNPDLETGFSSVSDCTRLGSKGTCYSNSTCDSKCGNTTSSYYYCNASGNCMGTNIKPSSGTYYTTSNCNSECHTPPPRPTPPSNADLECGNPTYCIGDNKYTFLTKNGVTRYYYNDRTNQTLCSIGPDSDQAGSRIIIGIPDTSSLCRSIELWEGNNISMSWGYGGAGPECTVTTCVWYHPGHTCSYEFTNPTDIVWTCGLWRSDSPPLYCLNETAPLGPTNGACPIDIGQFILPNVTPTNLCSAGTPSDPVLNATEWTWNCNGICGGNPISCSAFINSPPIFKGITIRNNSGNIVSADIGTSKNQICDPQFNGSRQVTFEVGASDPDGIADISSITLKWNGIPIPQIGSIGDITTFDFQEPFSPTMDKVTTYPLVVTIEDTKSQTVTNSSRMFKIWDCKVPVSGTIYDGSSAGFGITCNSERGLFSTLASGVNFKTLKFENVEMAVNTLTSSYNGDLIWGNSYIPHFNPDFAGSTPVMKVPNQPSCPSDLTLNKIVVDPYSSSIGVTADFSTIINQESWWQVAGGGVMARTKIQDMVPVTCGISSDSDICQKAVTVDNMGIGVSNNGIVAATDADSGSSSSKYGIPNNWYTNNNLVQETYDYTYFYNKYHVNLGQGVTIPTSATMTDINNIGSPGVVFIKGNLDIDVDNTVPINNFLMVIVSGDINIDIGVSKVEGLFVGKNITIGDSSSDQLVINGSLYAWGGLSGGNVTISRGFIKKNDNNTKPAVVVNYRPDFIFSMPGKLIKVLSGWKLGI